MLHPCSRADGSVLISFVLFSVVANWKVIMMLIMIVMLLMMMMMMISGWLQIYTVNIYDN